MTTTVLAFIPSPSQGVWHLGFVPIRAYALCIIVGIVAALILGDRRWVARGGEPGVVYDLALWAVPFGLIGGRLYHVMTDWQKYFGPDGAGFLAALRIWDGGLGIWGAVALGGVGAWIACRRRGLPLPAFGDAIAPGIILAQAIGRLGNYFNQELYGRETDLPWGLTIYQRLDPSGVISPHSLDGVSTGQVYAVVHPTFLYELLWNLLVFALLLWADKRFNLGHGRLFALYVAGYCVGRFWVELMRSDTATLIAGIRVNTFTSTFVFIGAVIYIMVAPKGREDPKALLGKDVGGSRLDDVGEELTAVAATSGVVAAAKVAGDEDKTPSGETTSKTEFTGGADVESEAAAENEDLIEQVENASSKDIATGEAFAAEGESGDGESADADEADAEFLGGADVESEAAAENEDLIEQVENASSEDIATGEAFAAEGAAADESTAPPEDGLLSVEVDEVAAAQDDAAEVHDAAVEGTETATATAEDVATEDAEDTADESIALPEEGDAVQDEETATATTEDVTAESAEDPDDDSTARPEDGLLSVDGDEVAAAQDDAAIEGTETAAAAAEDVATEGAEDTADESIALPEEGDAVQDEETATATTEDVTAQSAEDAASDSTARPEDGLLSIDGDEVAAAQDDAAEVHDAAIEGTETATAAAEDVATESTEDAASDSTARPEDGLLSVDGDEVAAAQDDAAEVHDAAVEGTETATVTAEDVTAEVADTEDPADDSTARPEDGLLSVDGDEVAAAQDDAAQVHDAAIEGTETATATADAVATEDAEDAEDTADESIAPPEEGDVVQDEETATAAADDVTAESAEDPDDDSTARPEDGLLSVDGDEVAATQDDAAEVHDAAVEGTETAEDVATETPSDPPARPYVTPRRRWWRRG